MSSGAAFLWLQHAFGTQPGSNAGPLLTGQRRIAIIGSLPDAPPGCVSPYLLDVGAVTVVAPDHPLARAKGVVLRTVAEQHVRLLLTDRSPLTQGRNFGVQSDRVWRLADLGAKHAFLRAGLGWGHMPLHMVEGNLRDGTLVRITLETSPTVGPVFLMAAIHRKDFPPGPAGRWFVERLNDSQARGGVGGRV